MGKENPTWTTEDLIDFGNIVLHPNRTKAVEKSIADNKVDKVNNPDLVAFFLSKGISLEESDKEANRSISEKWATEIGKHLGLTKEEALKAKDAGYTSPKEVMDFWGLKETKSG